MQALSALKDRTQWAIDHVLKEHDLKNTELSRIIRSKPDTVRKYRSKLSTPGVNFIKKFCAAFEIDFQWLYTGEGTPFPGRNVQCLATSGDTENRSCEAGGQAISSKEPDRHAASTSPSDRYSDVVCSDIEMSFQKLALLAGIKINSEWILRLSKAIGVVSWKISLSIYNQQIDGELIYAAESSGYPQKDWLVVNLPKNAVSERDDDELNMSRLLKIAEEVLQSNTIHSTSLAMNIISLKAMSDDQSSAHVRGGRAISMSKSKDLQLIK
jgi:hypothetical protein